MTQRTTWNLGLLYKGNNDPEIEKDLKAIEKACTAFEKKYKGKDFTSTASKLKVALDDSEKLSLAIKGSKPWWYFALKVDLDSGDSNSSARATKYEQRITEATNRVTFFHLEIAKISKQKQKEFLKNKVLHPYKYQLEKIFRSAKYNLTEGEEQLADLLSQPAYGAWIDGREKFLYQQTVEFKGKKIPVVEVVSTLSEYKEADRKALAEKLNEVFKKVSVFAEPELNAVYNFKKIMDERRGFKTPYSSSVLGNEQEDVVVESLINLVTKNFKIAHRFYNLHAKLLKEKKIGHEDRQVKIGEIKKKFSFETASNIVRDTFSKIDPKYSEIFDNFLKEGRFDVYPRKGKKGGAYCWGMGELPTFVLLNHVDDIRSVETLAHEMGHAIHTELSKVQPPRYEKYSMAAAEVASTFFEQAVVDALENELSIKERVILLHNKIMGDMSTIFRQVAFFNFELELHNLIREKGQVSSEKIAELMSRHLKSYMGPVADITLDDGYFYVYISHIRRFFYVYTYAYGQIVSRALYENWKKDPKYAAKVERFLSAGRSMSPDDIFKSIGINTRDPKFFEAGLKGIEADIKRLEKLAKKA
jgi:oligoendopeptidase F